MLVRLASWGMAYFHESIALLLYKNVHPLLNRQSGEKGSTGYENPNHLQLAFIYIIHPQTPKHR